MQRPDTMRPRGRLRRALGAVAAAHLLLVAACDGLLDVKTPDRIPASEVERPENAALLVNSAVGDFECALGAYVVAGGLIGEELVDATQTANRYPYDQRNLVPSDARYSTFDCVNLGVYTPLNTARAAADNVLAALVQWTDAEVEDRQRLIATAAAYAGYSLVLLGEGFCSATISTLDSDGNIVYGEEMSRQRVMQEAETRFTQAIQAAQAAGDARLLNLARLGRARARLNLARYGDAAADAALIPAGFEVNASASLASARRQNRVWSQNSEQNDATSVGAPYRGLDDPRVPVRHKGRSSVTGVELWEQLKYDEGSTPLPLATYEEARLIVAEAAARAGTLGPAIAIIQEFRTRGGQPAFTGTTQAEVMAEIIDQRRRELFLEGHHLGDVIRYDLSLSPAPGSPFHGGGVYGDARCMPLPDVERLNNPNID